MAADRHGLQHALVFLNAGLTLCFGSVHNPFALDQAAGATAEEDEVGDEMGASMPQYAQPAVQPCLKVGVQPAACSFLLYCNVPFHLPLTTV